MKWCKLSLVLVILLFAYISRGNNIRLGKVSYSSSDLLGGRTVLTLRFTVEWDNSWCDAYNHDAAYVFLKYRVMTDAEGEWHPLYISEAGCDNPDYGCRLAPGAAGDLGVGVFVERRSVGHGNVSTTVTLKWDITSNSRRVLEEGDFRYKRVLLFASGIEMVRVPRGPFRLGDNSSQNGFCREYTPFPSSVDLIDALQRIVATSGNAYLAADRIGSGVNDTTSCWIPEPWDTEPFWRIDFGEGNAKCIRYIGICGARGGAVPGRWSLMATDDPDGDGSGDRVFFTKGASDWVVAETSSYPAEQTIALDNDRAYRYYRLDFSSFSGALAVKSISMTDADIPLVRDHTVLVDADTLVIDSKRHLGASDGEAWTSGVTPRAYPNGYRSFYVMKYELTQEQYVDFLNHLTLGQQQGLLPQLSGLGEGDYLFGDPGRASCRNGIVIERKPSGSPVVFANNYDSSDLPGYPSDGETLACNYLGLQDLLSYASWSGLRPLSELEYEKLGRPLYRYEDVPLAGEYAWNTLHLEAAGEILDAGSVSESVTGNANYGGTEGPLRSGAFAGRDVVSREKSGAGYWGCFELSGNLSEPYYNVNAAGRAFRARDFASSHGTGYLTASGGHEPVSSWPLSAEAFAVRGGSFASAESGELSVSDRRRFRGYFRSVTERDSTVGMRLGRSCTEEEGAEVINTLTLENGMVAAGAVIACDTVADGADYVIRGSDAAGIDGVYSVLWYKGEDDRPEWIPMDGYTENGLQLKRLTGRFGKGSKMREYRYCRRIITPRGESVSQVRICVADPGWRINSRRETLVFGTTSHGFTVTANNAGVKVKWKDLKSGRELYETQATPTTSLYRAVCNDFPDIVFGEERKIEADVTINGVIHAKDTVVYVIPVPQHRLDKQEVEIDWTGTKGITYTSNYLMDVTWKDIQSGAILLTSKRVLQSPFFLKWSDHPDWAPESKRKMEIKATSVEGCYQWVDTVTIILPPCQQNYPFASSTQRFNNTTGSVNELQLQTTQWPSSTPVTWSLEGTTGSISINGSTGKLSGLSATVCNVTVCVKDQRCPDRVHRLAVKENYREFGYTGGVQSVLLSAGSYKFECWGAQGGGLGNSTSGGKGGYAYGITSSYSGSRIYVYVGGAGQNSTANIDGNNDGVRYRGGWNGGGNGTGSRGPGGGGMTHMSLYGNDRLVFGTRSRSISIPGSGYRITWRHPSGCTYANQTHYFDYSTTNPSRCEYCNHTCLQSKSYTAKTTTKSVTESYISVRTFNTPLLVGAGGGGGGNGSSPSSNGVMGMGSCGDVVRHSGCCSNDEAGGGGGYYGGNTIHGDDPSSAYSGTNYTGSLGSAGNSYGSRSGHGLARITVQ